MKYLPIFAIALLVAGCINCIALDGTGATAIRIAVDIAGKRYDGIYVKNYEAGRLVNASGVVLGTIPFTVESTLKGETSVRYGDNTMQWPGRPIIIIEAPNSTTQVICTNIPFDTFTSEADVLEYVQKMIKERAEQASPGYPPQGVGSPDP